MELFVGMQRRQLSDKCGWDLLNVVVSGDLLGRLPVTDRLYGHPASGCSCCYRPQGSTPHHVSIMGYLLSFSRLDASLVRPEST